MRGTKALLDTLDRLYDAVESGVPKAIADDVEKNATQAQEGFASAQYDGTNDVVVTMDSGPKTWRITASGTATLFIEYGSGITYQHNSGFGDYGMYPPASWSATHSQWLVDPRLSWFKGKWPVPGHKDLWTKGNPSANVMYMTEKALQTSVKLEANRAVERALKK